MQDEGSSRLWRGMRSLLFGEDSEATLRDQIEEAIDDAEGQRPRRGDLSVLERQMLRNLLHFGDRQVRDVMVTRGEIVAVPQTISFEDLVAAFAETEHSRLPVYGEALDEIVGMVHIKDVYKALTTPGRPRRIDSLLRTPLYIPESMGVLDLLARMRQGRVHLAIVVDEFGGTEGLLTIEDVVEEIVGDIEDEHDEAVVERLTRLDDGLWEADARVELSEVAEAIDPRLAEADDVETLGGLTTMIAGRLLEPGESVTHSSGWQLECIAADGRRLERIRLHAPAPERVDIDD